MNNLQPKHLSTKSDLEFTPQQKVFIQNFITQHRSELDNWEFNFLLVLFNSTHYSEQQKQTLSEIIKNK
jgi:tyrosine-protein phosphatase YwqE